MQWAIKAHCTPSAGRKRTVEDFRASRTSKQTRRPSLRSFIVTRPRSLTPLIPTLYYQPPSTTTHTMTILITGGTGFVVPHLASLLQSTPPPTPVLLTSRSPSPPTQQPESAAPFVRFDFHDPTTYALPFTHSLTQTSPITAIYLTPPTSPDASTVLISFIDFAFTQHNVRRFVLTAGNGASKGGRHVGEAWAHLDKLSQEHRVRYCVLRCTWFNDNFAWREHRKGIREEGRLYSCCGETGAGVPFLAASDIAACAMVVLLAEEGEGEGGWKWEESYELKGPEVLGFGEVSFYDGFWLALMAFADQVILLVRLRPSWARFSSGRSRMWRCLRKSWGVGLSMSRGYRSSWPSCWCGSMSRRRPGRRRR